MKKTRQESYKERRAYLLKIGKCVECGVRDSRENRTTCQHCFERIRTYQKKYNEKNVERRKEYHKQRYLKYKDKNICPRCKKHHNSRTYVYCRECRIFLTDNAFPYRQRNLQCK